jgi:hypothetical protein
MPREFRLPNASLIYLLFSTQSAVSSRQMADYYSIATAQITVPCSEDRFKKLTELLHAEVCDEDGKPAFHGFDLDYRNGKIYLER